VIVTVSSNMIAILETLLMIRLESDFAVAVVVMLATVDDVAVEVAIPLTAGSNVVSDVKDTPRPLTLAHADGMEGETSATKERAAH
jgi:hypothetical protein